MEYLFKQKGIIVHIVEFAQSCLRNIDTIGRYGSDEFGVVLFNTDSAQAAALATELREMIKKHPFPNKFDTAIVEAFLDIYKNDQSLPLFRRVS